MSFDDLSDSEKESLNRGLKDEYAQKNDYQKRIFREQLQEIFQVSGRTIRNWLSPNYRGGFLGKSKKRTRDADARANFARGLLRNPPIRDGKPTRSPKDYLGADGDKFSPKKFKEYLDNNTIWKELQGHISWQTNTFFLSYAADSDTELSEGGFLF